MAFVKGLPNLILNLNEDGYAYLERIAFTERITQNQFRLVFSAACSRTANDGAIPTHARQDLLFHMKLTIVSGSCLDKKKKKKETK